jgi:hypothetical protein
MWSDACLAFANHASLVGRCEFVFLVSPGPRVVVGCLDSSSQWYARRQGRQGRKINNEAEDLFPGAILPAPGLQGLRNSYLLTHTLDFCSF